MIKTIFYRKNTKPEADYYFEKTPYEEWFTLENILYEPNGNIEKSLKNENNIIKRIVPTKTQDTFSNNGIIRRIALYIEL